MANNESTRAPAAGLPPLPAYAARNDYRRENYYTAEQMRDYGRAALASAPASAPLPLTLSRAQVDAIVYRCRQSGDDSTYAIVNAALSLARECLPAAPVADTLKLAQKCGATVYRNRAMPNEPAVAFGNESWAKFCAALSGGSPEPVSGSEGEEEGGAR